MGGIGYIDPAGNTFGSHLGFAGKVGHRSHRSEPIGQRGRITEGGPHGMAMVIGPTALL